MCIVTALVLKARIANAIDQDFIEVEFDKEELTFSNFCHKCCEELAVKPDMITKIRKLPNTVVRNDRDMKRLVDFQEMELVLNTYAASAKGFVKNPTQNTVLYY